MRNEIRSAVISAISFCLLGGMGDGSITVDNDISVEGARVALARVGVRMLFDRKDGIFVCFEGVEVGSGVQNKGSRGN